MKTKIYLSKIDLLLHNAIYQLDYYYPEYQRHPSEYWDFALNKLIGKSFCTHHEAFVNIFGEFIYNELLPEDVELHLLQLNDWGEVEEKIVNYTEDGFVGEGWKPGFFNWSKW
jgi:hypothetical protein